MTIFRRSVKVIMSKEEILRIKPRIGIDLLFEPVRTNSNIYVVTISGTDLNPANPLEEIEQNDIDEIISEQLKIFSDRVRESKDLQKIPKVAKQMAMSLSDKRLDSNKYDKLRSKALQRSTSKLLRAENEATSLDQSNNDFETIQEG